MLKKASLLGWILVWIVLPLSVEAKDLRKKLIQHIESIDTLEAEFQETGPEGEATGRIFLKRPNSKNPKGFGSIKFIYNPPKLVEIVSCDGRVYVANHKTKEIDHNEPLSSTPLFILLRAEIRLGDLAIEKELKEEGGFIYWTLTKESTTEEEHPEITFIFESGSMEFIGWTIHDLTGKETMVRLSGIKKGIPLEEDIFKKPTFGKK
ncbi:MAG: outer membrane lipoprotein carrier protein LolA [Holosporales bacterium]|nr:outer membrane lipoprotein carrier protein LolA [Holosporales bacterium]